MAAAFLAGESFGAITATALQIAVSCASIAARCFAVSARYFADCCTFCWVR